MFTFEECHLWFWLERTPVSADDAIVGNNGLEDTRIIVSMMLMLGIENNISALIANQIFIVGRNQKKFAFSDTSRSAILMKIESLSFVRIAVKMIAYRLYTTLTVANI